MATVAVVDIGSNSIKVLVARSGAHGLPDTLLSKTIEARISEGIGKITPALAEAGMSRGVEAIRELLQQAASFQPGRIQLVATSAVRDALNGEVFRARVQASTGYAIRILSGTEEAAYIGRGITCDPDLCQLQDFYLFDLGGGSLECLAFAQRTIRQAQSLQLGCVRLTERFVADRTAVVSEETLATIRHHTAMVLRERGFGFDLPAGTTAVGTGGTLATARAMLAAREGRDLQQINPLIPVAVLRVLLNELRQFDLARRRTVPGLSPERADVFPAALATLIAVADTGGFAAYHHSFFNLRYGLAAELLAD